MISLLLVFCSSFDLPILFELSLFIGRIRSGVDKEEEGGIL